MSRTEALIKAQKKYYEKNKEKLKIYAKNKYLEKSTHTPRVRCNSDSALIRNRRLWDSILKERGMDRCQICGYNEHFSVIEFHHINPAEKKYQFNNMYRMYPTPARLLEVDKCVALCANCHRLVHNNVISIYRDIFGWHRK